MAATYVLDTSFLYCLAAHEGYSMTVMGRWSEAGSSFVVPGRVVGEIGSHRGDDVPPDAPELPRKAQGILSYWKVATVELEADDLAEAEQNRRAVSVRQDENGGEWECAVLVARTFEGAVMCTDDFSCLESIAAYVADTTGGAFSYLTTTDVLDGLVQADVLSAKERAAIVKILKKKGRPVS